MDNAAPAWKKIIEEIAREAIQIPLWGNPPPFPWKPFETLLQQRLGIPDFHIEHRRSDWISPDNWREGLSTKPYVLAIETPALKGCLFWVSSFEEIRETSKSFLLSTGHVAEGIRETPAAFFEGFYRYIFLEALDALSEIDAFPGLHLSLADQQKIPSEPLLSVEVALSSKGTKSFGKLLLPSQTLASFREFFSEESRSKLENENTARIETTLSLVAGKTTLKHSDWKKISIGDLLLLDQCDYHPKTKHGKVHLTLEGKPIALCSLKEHSLEVLDYHTYEEEIVQYNDDEPEEDFSSYDFPENQDEEIESEDYDTEQNEDNQSHYDENEAEKHVEEDYEEDLSDEAQPTQSVETVQDAPALVKDLSLTLCVEVTRIKMSLDKILELRPGNILELSSSPEQSVTLTVGGKAVARGELVQIGEVLGVKITQLG